MHIFHLILFVWDGAHIECCMVNLLVGFDVQIKWFDGWIICWFTCRIDGQLPQVGYGITFSD